MAKGGSLSCLPCPRCVGIGPGLLPWLCGAPQASGSAQLPWPGPALLPCLCGLLRCPGLPSSPGLALPSCPACVRAPQAPGSAQLPWPGPVLLPCLCAGSSGAQVCPAPLARPFCPACAGSSGARVCPAPLAGPAPTGPLPPLWNALAFLPQSPCCTSDLKQLPWCGLTLMDNLFFMKKQEISCLFHKKIYKM